MANDFFVTPLGTSSALPAFNRHPTSFLVNVNQEYYLVDCGEGTQMQLRRYKIKFQRISSIFISHLHGDHYFGLIGLLNSMQLLGREKPLTIYAPSQLKSIIDIQLQVSHSKLTYPINWVDIDFKDSMIIHTDKKVSVTSLILDHKIDCSGFLFVEKEKPKKLIKSEIERLEIPISAIKDIQQGADYIDANGELIPNSLMTKAPEKTKSFAFCTDTKYLERLIPQINGVDLLYHEATFLNDQAKRAKATKHSTAIQAATIALKSGVTKLLLGHFSARYKSLEGFLEEAKPVFSNTELAEEGKQYAV